MTLGVGLRAYLFCYTITMSLPVDYNFRYYIGDTDSFILRPRNRDKSPFDLTGYTASFVISNKTGPNPPWSVDGHVELNSTAGTIKCTIHPDVGNQLAEKTPYFYDVEIRKSSGGVETVYTLLKGTLTPVHGVNRSV